MINPYTSLMNVNGSNHCTMIIVTRLVVIHVGETESPTYQMSCGLDILPKQILQWTVEKTERELAGNRYIQSYVSVGAVKAFTSFRKLKARQWFNEV